MAPLKKSGVTGDKELIAALRELSKGPTPAEIDAAAQEAMAPMLSRAKEKIRGNRNFVGKWPAFFTQPKTPRSGGHVDEGVIFRKSGKQGAKARKYRLGATKRARYLLHLLEFGTRPHFQPNFHGGFMHPGARPYPALIPSYDEEKGKVPERFGRRIGQVLAGKISKLKKGPGRKR